MREKLISFINDLFTSAPDTQKNRELRDEMLADSLEKYDDLVAEGTPENAAFNLVVGGMGDVSELMREINGAGTNAAYGAGANAAQGANVPSATGSAKGSEAGERGRGKKQAKEKDPLFKSLDGLLWALVFAAYFILSFTTHAWHVTWLCFPIGGALTGVMKAIFDLARSGGDKK